MQIAFTEEQEALRKELRAYFANLMTPEVQDEMSSGDGEYGNGDLYKRLGPQKGQERRMIEQLIFMDEASLASAPVPFLTINTVGPTIMHYGTDEQKKEFLPKILGGQLHFSIGYSEPEAGTDLASLTTKAVRDGEEWVINGQKMWMSLIQYADYVWLAVRTDPEAPKHKGLSMLLVRL